VTSPLGHLLPEPPRLDRHETYVGILIYVWVASVGIYMLPIGTGAIGDMSAEQQKLLAACMFIGSTLCLFGSAMGEPLTLRATRPFRWLLKSRVATWIRGGELYAPMPVRHCYRLAISGLVANVTAFTFFTGQLLTSGSVVGSMTGLLPPILVVTWTRKIRKFWRLAAEMDRDYELLKRDVHEGDQ
jgi:hypothetical protein